MSEIIIEPLRWLETSARVTIHLSGDMPQSRFQITTPRDVERLCIGRPVEELPRILTILAPAHHLAAAHTVDGLFGVEPTETAACRREALLQHLFLEHHLRKLYFLISSRFNPLSVKSHTTGFGRPSPSSHPMLTDIMNHINMSQEAAVILGGRFDHPVTSVAGGVSRSKEEEDYEMLAQIADSGRVFCLRLAAFLHEAFFENGAVFPPEQNQEFAPLQGLTLSEEGRTISLYSETGTSKESFAPHEFRQKIGRHAESWTYQPFAYLKGSGGGFDLKEFCGIEGLTYGQCLFVGSLARLNAGGHLSPAAAAERDRMLQRFGPPPWFHPAAAFGSLLVETFDCFEKLVTLQEPDSIGGENLRNSPGPMRNEAHGVLESPQGLIYHHYQVDDRGVVTGADIFEATLLNNALRCVQIQQVVAACLSDGMPPAEIKRQIEMTLLPFC